MKRLILAVCLCSFIGCVAGKTHKGAMQFYNDQLLLLEMGMSKEDVLDRMGKPQLNEAYESLKGKSVVIYYYYTHGTGSFGTDDAVEKSECTPVVFENGRLVGWGDEFHKAKLEVDVNIK